MGHFANATIKGKGICFWWRPITTTALHKTFLYKTFIYTVYIYIVTPKGQLLIHLQFFSSAQLRSFSYFWFDPEGSTFVFFNESDRTEEVAELLTVREAICPPSPIYQYTFFTDRLFSEAAAVLTV